MKASYAHYDIDNLQGKFVFPDKVYTFVGHEVRSGVRFVVHNTKIACIGYGQLVKRVQRHYKNTTKNK